MKVALVHDYLTQYGGAERVLEELCLLYPSAPIFTLLYDEHSTGGAFSGREIYTSFLQKLPFATSFHRLLPLLMPSAIERFDLSEYDVVVSSSASFAKGVVTPPSTVHICYCHTPTRFAWFDYKKIAGKSLYPRGLSLLFPFALPYLRLWDLESAQRVDAYVCNSRFIQHKIQKYYHRRATVISPPVHTSRFYIGTPKEYFLVVGRMLPYKRFDIAIEAFNELALPLVVVGDGPELSKLKAKAGPTISFAGQVSDASLAWYYAHAQALVFPQEEDFGISALESMASGRPVIAYGRGGATEYIREKENGLFFKEQTASSLREAVEAYARIPWNPQAIRESVLPYDRLRFATAMRSFVQRTVEKRKQSYAHRR